jgi:hypothetical protein
VVLAVSGSLLEFALIVAAVVAIIGTVRNALR